MLRCCSKRVGLWLSYRLACTSMFCFLLSRQLYLAASHTKGTRRVCTLPLHRETSSTWLQEHAGVMEKLIDNSVRTLLYRLRHSRNMHRTDKVISTKTPFAQFCHTSFIHSFFCWFIPGTHISPPQFRTAHPLLQCPCLCHSFNPSHNLSIFLAFNTEMSSRDDGTQ